MALKPEGTASIGRAIIENKLYLSKQYNKLYYIDSMYRYEKPQKGRLRQFYQIEVELINELCLNSILDSIVLANSFLKKLITVIAVFGNAIVLFGTATAPNGLTYFIINILFIGAGFLLMKKN